MADPSCASCRHWTPPKSRDDFGHAVTISPAQYGDAALSAAAREAQDEADKTFGICKAIDLCDLTLGDPIPLASTRDASDYIATLYTQAAFGCAMWAENGETAPRQSED